MRRFQFSIASLLSTILVVALGIASLRSASDAWDSGVLAIVLLTLLVAVLLAVHRSDRARAYWLGFALFGWAYFLVGLIPSIEARLGTTRGLAVLASGLSGTMGSGIAVADYDSDGDVDLFVTNGGALGNIFLNKGNGTFVDASKIQPAINETRSAMLWRLLVGTSGTPENRARILHSIVSLLLAFAGGHLSCFLYAKGRGAHDGAQREPSDRGLPA
jgi:hypothetical protein